MKKVITIALLTISLTGFAQEDNGLRSEQMTLAMWDEEAKTNIRLLPKYGNAEKTEDQKKLDKEFVETVLRQDGNARKASDHMIRLGFNYLYKDIKTAMYRFNQAFLLDTTNSDIYWGYAGVYMMLGDFEKARQQYTEGLKINPNNTHLLTDYGTYYLSQYYGLKDIASKDANENLDLAIEYMGRSYKLDPNDQNTLFKLSVCYFNKRDCENAHLFYKKCKSLGGQPIPKEYEVEIKAACK